MKLNKTEIEAISSRITEELMAAANAKQKELDAIQDAANKPAAVAAIKAVKTMNKTLRDYLESKTTVAELTVGQLIKHMRKNQTEIDVPYRYGGDVRTALIIAQIDCPDVASLIEKVKASFIKI